MSMPAQVPQTAAKKPLYEGSTQYKNWRFSPEELTRIRASLNAAAVSVIRHTFEADEVCCKYSVSPLLKKKQSSD
jgi:cyclin H